MKDEKKLDACDCITSRVQISKYHSKYIYISPRDAKPFTAKGEPWPNDLGAVLGFQARC